MENKVKKYNFLKISIYTFLFLILFWVISYFSFDYYQKISVNNINSISLKKIKNLDECRQVFSFDKSEYKNNKYFNKAWFDESLNYCKKFFDLESLSLNSCWEILSYSNEYFSKNYVFTETLEKKREICAKNNFSPNILISSYFNIYNNFKTRIVLSNVWNFFNEARSVPKENQKYPIYQSEAKDFLKKLLVFSPEVELKDENIIFGDDEIYLDVDLKPETKYKLSYVSNIDWKKEELKSLEFTTPAKKHFWFRVTNPVTLYTSKNLPKFEIIDFASEKQNTKVKICRISEENYAKVEVFRATKDKDSAKKYFLENLEKFKNDCQEREVSLSEKKEWILNKFAFDFNDYLKDKNWLFFVSFQNKDDYEYNWKYNYPIFFGKSNANILMKMAKNGDTTFFVNDLETWKWLENQEIFAYLNDFIEWSSQYQEGKEVVNYNFPINWEVLKNVTSLWKTDKDWFLKVNLNEKLKIDDSFYRTDKNYNYTSLEDLKSFFIKSTWENHISYMSSTWNWWIEPWNFGYNWNEEYNLSSWSDKKLNWHLFTDRVLYLPWEEVNIKWIVRNSNDLSAPNKEKLQLSIYWPGLEERTEEVTTNEFWSFFSKFEIPKTAENWVYHLSIKSKNDEYISNTDFTVEVFKKPIIKANVSLETSWLNWEYVKITETKDSDKYFWAKDYLSNFKIKASIDAKYYNWASVANKTFSYNVYKQQYFEKDYWDDCYYWCFWEAQKEFYTSWTASTDANWKATFDINIDYSSRFDDYKYIVEVNIPNDSWDEDTFSNSVLAKLPDSLKSYNPNNNLTFSTSSRFVKAWERFKITWWLQKWKWLPEYNNNYIFIVKRKEYKNQKVVDANWFERNIYNSKEILENIFFVNDKNFSVNEKWQLELDYKVVKTWEYLFEYGPLDKSLIAKYLKIEDPNKLSNQDIQSVLDKFEQKQDISLNYDDSNEICVESSEVSSAIRAVQNIVKIKDAYCLAQKLNIENEHFGLNKLFSWSRKYFWIISYSENANASNPVKDDNKLAVLTDKVSYKIWEKAKILVRLPVSKSRILLTTERDSVKNYEFVDVEWNIFFKEIEVNDSFAPNSYIWVFMEDLESEVPQYKVWYTEIVIDKTDKKAEIDLKTDKNIYSPREDVNIDLEVKNTNWKAIKSEITVMVVDDSLISLMGNINPNTLEFIYQKYPFSIQTSMTNIAMLRNYYFSRKWIVWGSWFGDLKWWDSAISTRNIFKNTAFYWTVITDENGKAKLKFKLPDNLTSFRIMAISNSKDNYFWYNEKFIEVKKALVLEDRTPFILRDWDISEIWATLSNNSWKDLTLKVSVSNDKNLEIKNNNQTVILKSWETKYVPFEIVVKSNSEETLKYIISAIWDNAEHSDKIEKTIQIKENPLLITNHQKFAILDENLPLDLDFKIPENTDPDKTIVELTFANNKIIWVENILKNNSKDPYFYDADDYTSIISKNLIAKKFSKFFKEIYDEKKGNEEIKDSLKKLSEFQNSDWGFAYFKGWSSSEYLTILTVNSLFDLDKKEISEWIIEKAINYLENFYKNSLWDSEWDENIRANIYTVLKKAWRNPEKRFDENAINRYSLINYTSALLKEKDKNISEITKNIDLINKSFFEKIERKDFYSWDKYLEKANFTSLLLDLWDEKYFKDAEMYVSELYEQDWTNWYFSNETKNSVLIAFNKYLEKTYKDNNSRFGFSIWSHWERWYKSISKESPILKYTYKLSDILKWESLHIKAVSQSSAPTFVGLNFKQFPKDKTKVKAFANKASIIKDIFEVVDENKLLKCQNSEVYDDCAWVLKRVDWINFEKGKTYKVKISVNTDNSDIRNQITLIDYLPATAQVINSKFLNVSSNFANDNNWNWFNVQKNWNLIQAVTYTSSTQLEFEYYFKAGFTWSFLAPPTIVKELYNPDRNANTSFKEVKVK